MADQQEKQYFQDFMPGNVCFGCGRDNHFGLKISSFWEGDEAVCIWNSEEKTCGKWIPIPTAKKAWRQLPNDAHSAVQTQPDLR